MAGNKSCEGKLCVDKVFVMKENENIAGANFSPGKELNKIGKASEEGGIDIANTLKALKAITRESKKATAALRELEEKKKDKYLVIEVDELGNVPKVVYKGKEINFKEFVNFQWTTKSEVPGNTDVIVDYFEKDDWQVKSKSIREGISS